MSDNDPSGELKLGAAIRQDALASTFLHDALLAKSEGRDLDAADSLDVASALAREPANYFERVTQVHVDPHAKWQRVVDATCEHRHPSRKDAERCEPGCDVVLERSPDGVDVEVHAVRSFENG